MIRRQSLSLLLLIATGGCTAAVDTPPSGSTVPILQRINDTAQRCWMRSGDPAFQPYRIVPELDTRTGKPRILMLKAGNAAGLPQLVIEINGGTIDAYGPIQNTPLAARINRDIVRWANGTTSCEA
ncbi:hypothetical protein [Notoacmeibacter ruber]|uniref:Lipoprotein n=1 Tax=Notoacmeibacter ruber TaxID=2670375 RepID=A0A3L7JHV1_9HYPH|nr:hypothetical protein [Notoacmeibacter ruber]RLQ88072.1 hypothetical protein D8780_07475 [Notoacmeibacter ruber]